jgi:hypothetical protein
MPHPPAKAFGSERDCRHYSASSPESAAGGSGSKDACKAEGESARRLEHSEISLIVYRDSIGRSLCVVLIETASATALFPTHRFVARGSAQHIERDGIMVSRARSGCCRVSRNVTRMSRHHRFAALLAAPLFCGVVSLAAPAVRADPSSAEVPNIHVTGIYHSVTNGIANYDGFDRFRDANGQPLPSWEQELRSAG